MILFLNESVLICLHTVKWFQVLQPIANNSIKHQSFIYTQLNAQTVLVIAIRFNESHIFALNLNVKQFYLTQRYLLVKNSPGQSLLSLLGLYNTPLKRGKRQHPTSVLDITLNNLMVRFQWCWSERECKVPFDCHRSLVYSSSEW